MLVKILNKQSSGYSLSFHLIRSTVRELVNQNIIKNKNNSN